MLRGSSPRATTKSMKNKKMIKIKKIVIELGGKDVELTIDQAKELLEALSELFEVKEVIKTIPVPNPIEPFIPFKPVPKWPERPWKPEPNTWTDDHTSIFKLPEGVTITKLGNLVRLSGI